MPSDTERKPGKIRFTTDEITRVFRGLIATLDPNKKRILATVCGALATGVLLFSQIACISKAPINGSVPNQTQTSVTTKGPTFQMATPAPRTAVPSTVEKENKPMRTETPYTKEPTKGPDFSPQ
jgi:hypothetical protein